MTVHRVCIRNADTDAHAVVNSWRVVGVGVELATALSLQALLNDQINEPVDYQEYVYVEVGLHNEVVRAGYGNSGIKATCPGCGTVGTCPYCETCMVTQRELDGSVWSKQLRDYDASWLLPVDNFVTFVPTLEVT